jgi:hypothetical protein
MHAQLPIPEFLGLALGKDKKGFTYWRRTNSGQDYVYQISPNGQECGWICSFSAWCRTLHTLTNYRKGPNNAY